MLFFKKNFKYKILKKLFSKKKHCGILWNCVEFFVENVYISLILGVVKLDTKRGLFNLWIASLSKI